MSFQQWLQGKKTYFLAAIGSGIALYGWLSGYIPLDETLFYQWIAGITAAGRAAVSKNGGAK